MLTYSDLIKIPTINPPGNETPAAEYCKKLLKITQWGNLRLGNSGGYFKGCCNPNPANVRL